MNLNKTRYAIGLDLGSTNMRAAAVSSEGVVISDVVSSPVHAMSLSAHEILSNIAGLIRTVITMVPGVHIEGIGIGSAGTIDREAGCIADCSYLPSMNGFPICSLLSYEFGMPCTIENEASVFALGEYLHGCAKGVSSVLAVTLGSGIGTALISGGKLHRGAHGYFGEMRISPYGDGIIEDYVSGSALSRLYGERTGVKATGVEVASLARTGEPCALNVWECFMDGLSHALAWMINMMDPEMVIFGGSVARSCDLFLDGTSKMLKKMVCGQVASKLKLEVSSLGEDISVKGAASMVLTP